MVVGQDEALARAILAEMQDRLMGGPHSALGVSPQATPAEIRTAFLELTKIYHPARFGRLSTDTQKLSNEVFLAIRAAHDSIARPVRGSPRPPGGRQSSGMQPLRPSGQQTSVIPPVQTAPIPVARAAAPTPPSAQTAVVQSAPIAVPPRVTQPNPAQRSVPIKPMPTTGKPSGSGPIQQPAQARPSTPLKKPIDGEANVMELLHRGQWDAANAALDQLLASKPDSPRYRSLRAYAKGRKAQLGGQRDEARVELENALQLDPDLQLAKTALGELFTRRK